MYNSLAYYLIGFVAAFLLTYLLTAILADLAPKYNLFLDMPGSRRLHVKAVPRCGGLAIFIGFQIAAWFLLILPGFDQVSGHFAPEWFQNYLIASAALLVLGLLDDQRPLAWGIKLIGQVAVAIFMFACGVSVDSLLALELPTWATLAATVLWFIAIINAFNLIDGLDGLATGLAIAGAAGLAAVSFLSRSPADTILLLTLIGACLGFLRFNFHPARIFLGDSGSMFLGFTLATVALSRGAKMTMLTALAIPLLAAGVPIFDTLLAIWRRSVRSWRNGRSGTASAVAHADMEHLHHRLVRAGLSQRKVAFLLYGAALFMAGIGVLSIIYNTQAGAIFFLALIAAGYIAVRHLAHTELWDSGTLIIEGLRRPTRPTLAVVLCPLLDLMFLGSSLFFSLWLALPFPSVSDLKLLFLESISLWVGCPYLAMVFSKSYSRVWSRARVSEFVALAAALLLGVAVSMGITALVFQPPLRLLLTTTILYSALSGALICGLRALPRAIRDLMEFAAGGQEHSQGGVLVYGAGLSCSLYLKNQYERMMQSGQHLTLVGLVDDDVNLRKRVVHGYRVLGCSEEIPALVDRYQITKIVLACTPPLGRRAKLIRFAAARGITLVEWRCSEELQKLEMQQETLPKRLAF